MPDHHPHDDFDHDLWSDDGQVELRAADLTPEQLAAGLRAQAEGSYGVEASVGLVIDTDRWLRRSDFLDCIEACLQPSGRLLAAIDWPRLRAAQLPGSSGELRLLDVAAELVGIDSGTPLTDLIAGLDDRNFRLVLRAISHAHHGGDAFGPV